MPRDNLRKKKSERRLTDKPSFHLHVPAPSSDALPGDPDSLFLSLGTEDRKRCHRFDPASGSQNRPGEPDLLFLPAGGLDPETDLLVRLLRIPHPSTGPEPTFWIVEETLRNRKSFLGILLPLPLFDAVNRIHSHTAQPILPLCRHILPRLGAREAPLVLDPVTSQGRSVPSGAAPDLPFCLSTG
ncbi:MAG: hypothetical protein R2751_02205 [Bacteroidales bacterium]